MATAKQDMLASVASSMRERPGVSPGSAPGVSPGSAPAPSSLTRQREGCKRLEAAAVIRIDRIVADPNQPRSEFDDQSLARLAASLRERGQLQPIRVRWDDAMDRYVVVVGERRWRAARLAGLESLACVVVDGTATAEDLLEDQLVENALREDLRPIEQARAFDSLMKSRGLSTRQLADRLQISAGSVTKALALLGLPVPVQEDVDAGRIAPATAYELSKVGDPEEQAELAKEAARGRLRRDELKDLIGKPQQGGGAVKGKAKAKKVTSRVFRTTAGPRVTVELGRGLDVRTALAALEEVAGRLRDELGDGDKAAA